MIFVEDNQNIHFEEMVVVVVAENQVVNVEIHAYLVVVYPCVVVVVSLNVEEEEHLDDDDVVMEDQF